MRWFGKRTGERARPALTRGFAAGWTAAGDWPAGYEAQVRDAYLANPVAQRAVRIVAEAAASTPVYPRDDGHAAAAGLLDAAGLVETVATQLLLQGNAYLLLVPDLDGVPRELVPLRPERVTIDTDERGWPIAYLYRAGATQARYPVADEAGRLAVIHLRAANPLDDHYGTGSLGPASPAVAVHNAALRWNRALLDNAARPSGALVYEPGEGGAALSPEQFERLKAEMELGFAGAANAGRPMLLEGGLRWQALSLTPADMDFAGLKAAAAREIALAFGVPPMLLGLPGDSTYANYQEANRALWRLTVVPLLTKIAKSVGAALDPWWPGLALALDLDSVPALAGDRAALWAQVTAADFLTLDEKREMVGFGPREAA